MATAVLAVIFLFDDLMERKSVPLTKEALHVLEIPVAHSLKITDLANFGDWLTYKIPLLVL